MLGEVAAVLSALKALNDGLATLKESAGHGKSLQGLVGKWGEANEKYRDVERAKAGKMSYREALAMESAKRQLDNFDRQFKDICLLQGRGDLYNSVKNRMLESQKAHQREIAEIKRRRREIKKYLQIGGTVVFGWAFCMFFIWAIVWTMGG